MGRHEKRAREAVRRKGNVSVALLQKQLGEQSAELQQLRNVLFALVKEQGRIRVRKDTVNSLGPEDGLDAIESRDADGAEVYIVTYKRYTPDAGKESA